MARNKYDVDETLETPFSLEHLKRSLVYVKKHKKRMLQAVLFSLLASVFSLCTPLIIQYSLDHSVPNKNVPELIFMAVLLVISIGLVIAFVTIRARIMTIVGQDIIVDIRADLFAHLQELPFSYYDNRPHGKILVRVVHYVNNVCDLLSNGIINFVLELLNLVLITIFMFFVNVQLSLIVLAGLPLFLVVMMILKPMQRKAWQRFSNKNSNLNGYLQESLNGVKVTQIFNREETNQGIFNRLCDATKDTMMTAIYVSNFTWYGAQNISQWVSIFVYIGGAMWFATPVSFGTIMAMSDYANRFWSPINNLANLYNVFINTIAYLERIFETIDEPVEIKDAPDAYEMPPMKGQVDFENVTFGYEPGIHILENLSFSVTPGENIALVGPTGAGKSTVVNLISRFYNLNSGAVKIDGHDISKVTLHSLRSQMGIMMQDSFIFSGTILDNIRYGRLDATKEEVIEAAKMVKAHDFIVEMEDGYETEVNERGSRLSQGQKQLIAFARTLLSDPAILILDEATSAIDTKTEKLLQDGIQVLLKGRTSFIIAHRLSTIKSCDRIMYISNKGILESGNHEELIRKHGAYYELYTSQLAEQTPVMLNEKS